MFVLVIEIFYLTGEMLFCVSSVFAARSFAHVFSVSRKKEKKKAKVANGFFFIFNFILLLKFVLISEDDCSYLFINHDRNSSLKSWEGVEIMLEI